MNQKNTGKPFEKLTKVIFDHLTTNSKNVKIEMDVYLDGYDGKRQVDILITQELEYCTLKTMVECKDYNKKINVTVIDALPSKMSDISVNKAVVVSRKGFSKTALQKAKRLGIELFTLDNFENIIEELTPKIPILIQEVTVNSFSPEFKVELDGQTSLPYDCHHKINDQNIPIIFRELLFQHKLPLEFDKELTWNLEEVTRPYFIRSSTNKKIIIQEPRINYALKRNLFWGYVRDLPETVSLKKALSEEETIFIKNEDIINCRQYLQKFSWTSDLPIKPLVNFISIACPDFNLSEERVCINSLSSGKKMEFTTKISEKLITPLDDTSDASSANP